MSIFKDEELKEKLDVESTQEEDTEETEEEVQEFNPTISNESPEEKKARLGLREERDGAILTIKDWDFTKPKLKDSLGNKIEPKTTLKSKKPYYSVKLKITFEEDNLIEYYPNVKVYVNEGKLSQKISLPRYGKSCVFQIVKKVAAKMGKELDTLSDDDILEFLVGKKVKIKTEKDVYDGKPWFRNDIAEIL